MLVSETQRLPNFGHFSVYEKKSMSGSHLSSLERFLCTPSPQCQILLTKKQKHIHSCNPFIMWTTENSPVLPDLSTLGFITHWNPFTSNTAYAESHYLPSLIWSQGEYGRSWVSSRDKEPCICLKIWSRTSPNNLRVPQTPGRSHSSKGILNPGCVLGRCPRKVCFSPAG